MFDRNSEILLAEGNLQEDIEEKFREEYWKIFKVNRVLIRKVRIFNSENEIIPIFDFLQ